MKWLCIIAVVAILTGMTGVSSVAFAAGALDGKTFTVDSGNKNETSSRTDDFIFQDGQFSSMLCNRFGYGAGDYETAKENDTIYFEAKTASTHGGTMHWQGIVKGPDIEGISVTNENGTISESWFKGSLKQ